MNDNLEAVKKRIKKLLALSKSPNENDISLNRQTTGHGGRYLEYRK